MPMEIIKYNKEDRVGPTLFGNGLRVVPGWGAALTEVAQLSSHSASLEEEVLACCCLHESSTAQPEASCPHPHLPTPPPRTRLLWHIQSADLIMLSHQYISGMSNYAYRWLSLPGELHSCSLWTWTTQSIPWERRAPVSTAAPTVSMPAVCLHPPASPAKTKLLGFNFEAPCGPVLAPGEFLLGNSFNFPGSVLSLGHWPQVISTIPNSLKIGGVLRESRPSNHILTLIALEYFPFPYKDSMWNVDDLPSLRAKVELKSRFIFAIFWSIILILWKSTLQNDTIQ